MSIDGKTLKVRIYDIDAGWILGKFSKRLCEELVKMDIDAAIVKKYDPTADINHYPLYTFVDYYNLRRPHDTFMITHVDSLSKVDLLKSRLKRYGMGICMSKYTMEYLTSVGVPREKLCYINPAHDHVIKPRKYVIGLTYRTYQDCRKRDAFLVDIAKNIDSDYFRFVIMGAGWDKIVDEMRSLGFEVEYYNEFNYDCYVQLVPTFDFFLYFGNDEGNMGYLDALAAGVETIVTPQGFHLDAKGGLTYPCESLKDYVKTFDEVANRKKKLVESVQDWTWESFAKKHLEIWNYLLGRESLSDTFKNRGLYSDGIFSVLPREIGEGTMYANDIENRKVVNVVRKLIQDKSDLLGEK